MNDMPTVKHFAEPLYKSRKWMKFAGVFSVINGIFLVFTIWGIIIAWIPIWMGIILYSASNHLQTATETNNQNELQISFAKLGKYFKLYVISTLLAGIGTIGILAAIAVTAYQDYLIRAKIGESLTLSNGVKEKVTSYIQTHRTYPSSNDEIGLQNNINSKNVESIQVIKDGEIIIQFSKEMGPVAGKTIMLTPTIEESGVRWTCTAGTLDMKYRPRACR